MVGRRFSDHKLHAGGKAKDAVFLAANLTATVPLDKSEEFGFPVHFNPRL
jgi:hypothetical protein